MIGESSIHDTRQQSLGVLIRGDVDFTSVLFKRSTYKTLVGRRMISLQLLPVISPCPLSPAAFKCIGWSEAVSSLSKP